MNLFQYLIPFLLALGILIIIHELGHYLVARWCGVKVLRFSVGFGKPLFQRRYGRDQTEWVVAAFPLGGYVKMLDEREGEVPTRDLPRAFNRQTVGRRFAIVAAGPLANFLLAILLYWMLFVAGDRQLGTLVAEPVSPSIAAQLGVTAGDRVLAVDGVEVKSWSEMRWVLLQRAVRGDAVDLTLLRDNTLRFERRFDLSGINLDDKKNDLLTQLGLAPWRVPLPAVIGRLVRGGAAEQAGLQLGDRLLVLAGEPITDWADLVERVRAAPDAVFALAYERDGVFLETELHLSSEVERGERVGRIGIGVAEPRDGRPEMFVEVRYGPLEGLVKAVRQTWETTTLTLSMLAKMFTGEVSWKNLSGPVTIADYAGQTAQMGLAHYLKFLALISISLGVLNLLPIPVLDGGHLLYYTIEIIKGSPVSDKAMEYGQQFGLALLVMLMAFAFYNDINRLISG